MRLTPPSAARRPPHPAREQTKHWQDFFQARKGIPICFRKPVDRITSVAIPLALGGAAAYMLTTSVYRLVNGQKKLA